jgi:O-antigen/teichoic acid export membrane protein
MSFDDSKSGEHVEEKGVRSKLPAGVIDAGFASLATFLTGLVAVNVLTDVDRGIYAVFFVTFTLGAILVYQLVYVPTEIVAVGRPLHLRLTIVKDSLRIGLWPSIIGAMTIVGAAVSTLPIAEADLLVGLTVTGWIATLLSPTQDHLRRILHVADQSWHAAAMSIVQFAVTGAALGLMWLLDAPIAWIPFGALAIANIVSTSFGFMLVRHDNAGAHTDEVVRFRDISHSGRWLLLTAIIPAAVAFVSANIIAYLASPEALGYAEAARIVGQPILVLGSGLTFALRPKAMESALQRDRHRSMRIELLFAAMIITSALVYLPIAGGAWAWNPMHRLVPAAYEVEGLVIAVILTNTVLATAFLVANEMMAAGKARSLAVIEGVAAPLRMAAATSAAGIGAFARPVSEAVAAVTTWGGFLLLYRKWYDAPQDPNHTEVGADEMPGPGSAGNLPNRESVIEALDSDHQH